MPASLSFTPALPLTPHGPLPPALVPATQPLAQRWAEVSSVPCKQRQRMPLTATAHSRVKQPSRLLRELDTGPGSCSSLHHRWRKHEAIWIRSLAPGVGPFGSTLACLHLGGILHRASQNEGAHVFLCVHGRKSRIPPAVSARLQFKSPFTPSARVVVGLTCASICRGRLSPCLVALSASRQAQPPTEKAWAEE